MFRLAGQRLLSSSTSTASANTIFRSRAKQSASTTTVNQLWTATTGNSLLAITACQHHQRRRRQPQAAGIRCFAERVSTNPTSPDQSERQKKRAIREANWHSKYALLQQYKKDKGDCLVPTMYTVNGVALGKWVGAQRVQYHKFQKDEQSAKITQDRINKLDAVGFDWDPLKRQWNLRYALLQQYKKDKGNCRVPKSYAVDGVTLGVWVAVQRVQYQCLQEGKPSAMTGERIDKLETLGIDWDPLTTQWNSTYELLRQYYNEKGDSRVPEHHTVDGVDLGVWANNQRTEYRKLQESKLSNMTEERINKLEAVGFDWSLRETQWNSKYAILRQYYNDKGHCRVPQSYTVNGVALGRWARAQRKRYWKLQEGKPSCMTHEQIDKLEALGFDWSPQKIPRLLEK